VTTLSAPLRDDSVRAALKLNGRRTTLTFGGDYSEANFESASNLRKQRAYDIYLLATRQMNDFLSLSLEGGHQQTRFETAARKDRDSAFDAALTWKPGRTLSLTARVQYETRDSTDYDTTIIGLWAGYSPTRLGPSGP
jgi:uncharacterized protein (PEP-CTERM system associated)